MFFNKFVLVDCVAIYWPDPRVMMINKSTPLDDDLCESEVTYKKCLPTCVLTMQNLVLFT